jgi:hypothetical protein
MSCPYRTDVPSGIWAAEEYAKLPRYDAPTMEQPPQAFLCHQMDRSAPGARVCAGWAGCHDGGHLLALRFALMQGTMTGEDADATIDYVSPVPLFASGAEAAEHGMAEIGNPGPEAVVAMAKIGRRRSDLVPVEGGHRVTSSQPPHPATAPSRP